METKEIKSVKNGNEKKNSNKKPVSSVSKLSKRIDELAAENEKLLARLAEKDRYIHKIEDEYDAKLANKNFIINGQKNNIANLNLRIEQLEKQTPFWVKIFQKKKDK